MEAILTYSHSVCFNEKGVKYLLSLQKGEKNTFWVTGKLLFKFQISECFSELSPLLLKENICCVYSKELAHLDDSFQYLQHIYIVGTQKNRLTETILFSTYNIYFR